MKIFVTTIISIITLSIIVGIFVVGSPNQERLRRFDDLRLQHLQSIQSELLSYWQVKKILPTTLSELNDSLRGYTVPVDPDTSASYEYEKKGDSGFVLCATFVSSSRESNFGPKYASYPYPGGPFMGQENWEHETGRVCFERTIDSDFFRNEQRPEMIR